MKNITIQTIISIVAACISLIAVIVSIYYNHKNNKQYLKSLEPLLSFKLLELKSELYLRITNTGKSAANDIAIEIKKIENNGDRNELNLDARNLSYIQVNQHRDELLFGARQFVQVHFLK